MNSYNWFSHKFFFSLQRTALLRPLTLHWARSRLMDVAFIWTAIHSCCDKQVIHIVQHCRAFSVICKCSKRYIVVSSIDTRKKHQLKNELACGNIVLAPRCLPPSIQPHTTKTVGVSCTQWKWSSGGKQCNIHFWCPPNMLRWGSIGQKRNTCLHVVLRGTTTHLAGWNVSMTDWVVCAMHWIFNL